MTIQWHVSRMHSKSMYCAEITLEYKHRPRMLPIASFKDFVSGRDVFKGKESVIHKLMRAGFKKADVSEWFSKGSSSTVWQNSLYSGMCGTLETC